MLLKFWLACSIFQYRIACDSGSVCNIYPRRSYSWAENLLHMDERLGGKLLQKEVKQICVTVNWLISPALF